MRVYARQDQYLLPTVEDESAYKESVLPLYTSILEYEANLLLHLHRTPVKDWASSVFNTGDWTKHAKRIQELESRCRDITNVIARNEDRQWQSEMLQQPRREEENRNLRMLYSNYEAGKNVNPERIAGTCEWFLTHDKFLDWQQSQCSRLLWLSADPGCGKSVLAKHLVDGREKILTVNLEPTIICYFFFKDGDLDRIDSAKALCAILH